VSALYGYLVVRGDAGVSANPVPRGLPTRQRRRNGPKVVPLVRGVRRLPRILGPAGIDRLLGALRTDRDRAIVQAMLLAGLRRCEVLGLRLEDLRLGEWRVFVAHGKGDHERLVPMSTTFFTTVAAYLDSERPADATTDRVFVALKGPTRGGPLSASGLDEVMAGARGRAGLAGGTCHELRGANSGRRHRRGGRDAPTGGPAREAPQAGLAHQQPHASSPTTRPWPRASSSCTRR
jgi:integrase/recombinase XerD